MESTLKLAVVGAGYWGKNLVRNFAALPSVELVGICDQDPKIRKKMANQYPGVHITKELDEVLADPEVDAVALVTPAKFHSSQAVQVLHAGKHVYAEKPLGLSAAEAQEVARVADQTGKIAMVGHMLCYHPAVRYIKELIDSGQIGDIFYMYAQRVNLGRLRQDENALWSFGPHDLSVMLYLTGQTPDTVAARGRAYLQEGIEDVVFVNLTFPSGIMAQVQLSWLDPRKVRKLTLVGSKKMIEFDDTHPSEKLRIFDKGFERPPEFSSYGEYLSIRQGDILIPRVETTEPLKIELNHFVESCLSNRRPLTDAYNGLEVTRILEAAQTSMMQGGKPITIHR